MPGERRQRLFEDFSEEEFRDRITSTEVRRSETATTVTGTSQKVMEVGIASGEQLRVYRYDWFQADGNATRARLRAVASTGAWSSIVHRDYLDTPGAAPPREGDWRSPVFTVGMHADGSLTVLADALSGGAQASIDRVSATVHGQRFARLDEARL